MRFLLTLCAIGILSSWFGLYAQIAYYFHAEAVKEAGKTYTLITNDPAERTLSRYIPDEKSAAFAKSAFAQHREAGQQIGETVSGLGAKLKERALWDAGLWALQIIVLTIVFARLDAVRRGRRVLGA